MPDRHFPVHPNITQLRHQAKDLLRALHAVDLEAISDYHLHHPSPSSPQTAKLADAQLVLARNYDLPGWQRLVLACSITDAIWKDDAETVRKLILKYPSLLHESARGTRECNWGPPMSYAANVGRDNIISMLSDMGAADYQHAFERACLQGKLETARKLHELGGRPVRGSVMGPCETLNADGLSLLLELGSELCDVDGDPLAPVALVLESYSRYPEGKHKCLNVIEQQGIKLPQTAPMALHQGRIDLLEQYIQADRNLLSRCFSHAEIYPPKLGCHADESLALHGTPLAGTTLLHLCVDYDEIEIAKWLLAQGADVNARAELDIDGFGGHTPLFGCLVSQPYRCSRDSEGAFARLLLNHGADTTVRASLRKRLRFVKDETLHTYHQVTPLEWGQQFQDQDWVNPSVMKMIQDKLVL